MFSFNKPNENTEIVQTRLIKERFRLQFFEFFDSEVCSVTVMQNRWK